MIPQARTSLLIAPLRLNRCGIRFHSSAGTNLSFDILNPSSYRFIFITTTLLYLTSWISGILLSFLYISPIKVIYQFQCIHILSLTPSLSFSLAYLYRSLRAPTTSSAFVLIVIVHSDRNDPREARRYSQTKLPLPSDSHLHRDPFRADRFPPFPDRQQHVPSDAFDRTMAHPIL